MSHMSRYVRAIKMLLVLSVPLSAMENDNPNLLANPGALYVPLYYDTTVLLQPILNCEFEDRFTSCIEYPDYQGNNTPERLLCAKWLRINLDPQELYDQSLRARLKRLITLASSTYASGLSTRLSTPDADDLLDAMAYALSLMKGDIESTGQMLNLSEQDIVSQFMRNFPQVKYIEFYSPATAGIYACLDAKTTKLFNQLQDENKFYFYST
ncbi:hypothetical protein [Candidatus Odyssella thessalonicensis]|uniref:hypothetical protein n=1 Tax=Candidatus Odyssella thessalonicensis TaxID=84647 RepID=UPI001111F8F0|nr:hypothetical protein [Candidatus Odyssella thessalonicensis]